jgi:hypothetical protein
VNDKKNSNPHHFLLETFGIFILQSLASAKDVSKKVGGYTIEGQFFLYGSEQKSTKTFDTFCSFRGQRNVSRFALQKNH